MNKRYVKAIVLIVVLAMVITSFSFVAFLPMTTGALPTAYGAEDNAGGGADANGAAPLGANAGSASASGAQDGLAEAELSAELQKLEEYIKYIHENYKDDVTYQTLVDGAFSGVIDALGDPFSVFYADEEAAEQFTQQVDGSFEGVGVSLQMVDGKCTVISPTGGGPAAKAGIKSDDVITAVDGKSTDGMALADIVALLRGKAGSEVVVTVQRGDKSLSFTLKRDKVNSECVAYRMLEGDVGYISMSGFDNDAALEFKKARVALTNRGAEKLILDLRDNPGGYINMALEIADQILEEGYITHFESRGKLLDSYTATNSESVSQPIVLLVNGGTASASEILAAALLDNGAATAVGTTTYGKGIAQNVASLDDGKSVKLSIYYFLRPNRERIQDVGITPNYVVANRTTEDTAALEAEYGRFAPMTEKAKPKAGDRGLNVYGAQQRLAFLGYETEASGLMDDATVTAVRQFQQQNGLYAYGTLDYTTMNKLEAAAYRQAHGASAEDLQLAKAIELLR